MEAERLLRDGFAIARVGEFLLFGAAKLRIHRIGSNLCIQPGREVLHLLSPANHQRQQRARHGQYGFNPALAVAVFQFSPDERLAQVGRAKGRKLTHIVQFKGIQADGEACVKDAAFLSHFLNERSGRAVGGNRIEAADGRRIAGDHAQPGKIEIVKGIQQGIIRIVGKHGQAVVALILDGVDLVGERFAHALRAFGILKHTQSQLFHLVEHGGTQRIEAFVHLFRDERIQRSGHGIDGIGEHIAAQGTVFLCRGSFIRNTL